MINLLVLAASSGVAYRVGGKGGFPMAKLVRRVGCALIYTIACLLTGIPFGWPLILSTILLVLALSTYWDFLAPDKVNETYLCFFVTGLAYGLSSLPLPGIIPFWLIMARSVVLALVTMATLKWQDTISEWTRGFILIASLVIFNIGLK